MYPCLFFSSLPKCFVYGPLEKWRFQNLISVADYKMRESKMDKNPTWYPLTLDVSNSSFIWCPFLILIFAIFGEKYQMRPILQQGQNSMHFVVCGWYLDCYRGFVPEIEEPLYNCLVCSTPEVIELVEELEEDENPTPPTIV